MIYVVHFLIWTFLLYFIHRASHVLPVIREFHRDHHQFIRNHEVTWHWSNLFLYNDTLKSTVDLWITEVIPTILIAFLLNAWWLAVFYYLWAALVQETIEHNKHFDWPILSSGKWHLIHHKNYNKNYGLFFPMWDIVFGTNKRLTTP